MMAIIDIFVGTLAMVGAEIVFWSFGRVLKLLRTTFRDIMSH